MVQLAHKLHFILDAFLGDSTLFVDLDSCDLFNRFSDGSQHDPCGSPFPQKPYQGVPAQHRNLLLVLFLFLHNVEIQLNIILTWSIRTSICREYPVSLFMRQPRPKLVEKKHLKLITCQHNAC